MVPVFAAARLSFSSVFVFILFLTCVIYGTESLLVYDCRTLLGFQPLIQGMVSFVLVGKNSCPHFCLRFWLICAGFLHCHPGEDIIVVAVGEAANWSSWSFSWCIVLHLPDQCMDHFLDLLCLGVFWIPLMPAWCRALWPCFPCPLWLKMRRQCCGNLRPLYRAPWLVEAHASAIARVDLVEARSLAN